jgi:amino acid transporter
METFFEALFNAFLFLVYALIFLFLLVFAEAAFKGELKQKLKSIHLIIWLTMLFFCLYLYFYLDGTGFFPDWDKGWSPSRDGWP